MFEVANMAPNPASMIILGTSFHTRSSFSGLQTGSCDNKHPKPADVCQLPAPSGGSWDWRPFKREVKQKVHGAGFAELRIQRPKSFVRRLDLGVFPLT